MLAEYISELYTNAFLAKAQNELAYQEALLSAGPSIQIIKGIAQNGAVGYKAFLAGKEVKGIEVDALILQCLKEQQKRDATSAKIYAALPQNPHDFSTMNENTPVSSKEQALLCDLTTAFYNNWPYYTEAHKDALKHVLARLQHLESTVSILERCNKAQAETIGNYQLASVRRDDHIAALEKECSNTSCDYFKAKGQCIQLRDENRRLHGEMDSLKKLYASRPGWMGWGVHNQCSIDRPNGGGTITATQQEWVEAWDKRTVQVRPSAYAPAGVEFYSNDDKVYLRRNSNERAEYGTVNELVTRLRSVKELEQKLRAKEEELKSTREFSPKLPDGVTTDGMENIWMRKDGYSTFGSVSYFLNLARALQNANARSDEWQNKCAAAEKREAALGDITLLRNRATAWQTVEKKFSVLSWYADDTLSAPTFCDFVCRSIDELRSKLEAAEKRCEAMKAQVATPGLLQQAKAWVDLASRFCTIEWVNSGMPGDTFVLHKIAEFQDKAAKFDAIKHLAK